MPGGTTGPRTLDGRRDWGYAPDDTRAMRLILARLEPDEFVIATGEGHLARDWRDLAFNRVGLDYRQHVTTDPARWRPAAAVPLVGRSEQANRPLGAGPGRLAGGRADDGR